MPAALARRFSRFLRKVAPASAPRLFTATRYSVLQRIHSVDPIPRPLVDIRVLSTFDRMVRLRRMEIRLLWGHSRNARLDGSLPPLPGKPGVWCAPRCRQRQSARFSQSGRRKDAWGPHARRPWRLLREHNRAE